MSVGPSIGEELAGHLRREAATVTGFLEGRAGETIQAEVVSQEDRQAGPDNALALGASAPVVRRAVLLTGRSTGRLFVYAESTIAPSRLPESVMARLRGGREPIGRVLLEHGLSVRREALGGALGPESAAADIEPLLQEAVLSHRQRVLVGEVPAIDVCEWFLEPVSQILGDEAQGPGSSRRTISRPGPKRVGTSTPVAANPTRP